MIVTVNQEKCIGCGACAATCPKVFEIKSDGKAHVKEDADYSECNIDDVINVCPVQAISKKESEKND